MNTPACMYLVETAAQYTNKYFQKSLVGVIILREKVEKDIALNTAAIFPPWRRLKQHYSQWYLFHEPCRWLLPRLEPLFHYADKVRAIFRATDYSNKSLKHPVVLQFIYQIYCEPTNIWQRGSQQHFEIILGTPASRTCSLSGLTRA